MTESSTVSANALEIVIDIGHLPIQLRMQDAAFHELLSTRYAGFLSSNSKAEAVLDIDLALDPKITDGDVEVHIDNGHWVFQRADFAAEFDPVGRVGRIRQSRTHIRSIPCYAYCTVLLLVREGGFLLHAASAIRNGKAFLFSGLSGAGKTTISSLTPRRRNSADRRNLVRTSRGSGAISLVALRSPGNWHALAAIRRLPLRPLSF